jgi:tetratricopeptide (TPR) repeat protein
LQEVKNDPALQIVDPVIKAAVFEYNRNTDKYKDTKKFVQDALHDRILDWNLKEEIDQIKLEISEHNINEISEGWVKEWVENNHVGKTSDPNTLKIKNFIAQSLESEKNSSGLKIVQLRRVIWRRSSMKSIIGIAAALIAGVLLFRTLIPSDNPEKLYKTFYEPLAAVSPVTRGINSSKSEQYSEAIEMYNQKNYLVAASKFNELIQKDPVLAAPYFFQGLTQLELGNYNLAITNLAIVAVRSGDYMKEAQWYLGLSYLKTGEKIKAIPYFETLSASEGFYQDQAKKVLRRLK